MDYKCQNCGKDTDECKCLDEPDNEVDKVVISQQSKEALEKISMGILKKDIRNLKEKLLYLATKSFQPKGDRDGTKTEQEALMEAKREQHRGVKKVVNPIC